MSLATQDEPPPLPLRVHAVYITGTISAASGFDAGSLFCRWRVEHDLRSWRLVSGEPEGQTQAAEVVRNLPAQRAAATRRVACKGGARARVALRAGSRNAVAPKTVPAMRSVGGGGPGRGLLALFQVPPSRCIGSGLWPLWSKGFLPAANNRHSCRESSPLARPLAANFCFVLQDGEGIALWDHPIDLHLSATDVIGWPSLVLEVWRHESSTARNEQTGVALFRFPSVPGEHLREVGAWRPRGTAWEGFVAALGGPKPSLKSAEGAFTVNADRSDLTTVTAGTVIVECRIAVREMAGSGMVLQPMTGAEVKLVGDAIAGAYSAARKGGRYIDEEPDTAGAVGADEASSGPSAARGYAGSR